MVLDGQGVASVQANSGCCGFSLGEWQVVSYGERKDLGGYQMMKMVKASCWAIYGQIHKEKKVGDQWVVVDGLAIWQYMVVLGATSWVSTKEKSTPWWLWCCRGCRDYFILDKENKKRSKFGCCNQVILLRD